MPYYVSGYLKTAQAGRGMETKRASQSCSRTSRGGVPACTAIVSCCGSPLHFKVNALQAIVDLTEALEVDPLLTHDLLLERGWLDEVR